MLLDKNFSNNNSNTESASLYVITSNTEFPRLWLQEDAGRIPSKDTFMISHWLRRYSSLVISVAINAQKVQKHNSKIKALREQEWPAPVALGCKPSRWTVTHLDVQPLSYVAGGCSSDLRDRSKAQEFWLPIRAK